MRIILTLSLLLVAACAENPNYLKLGVDSFNVENYSLAKNQLEMIKPNDDNFQIALGYLSRIDSIQKTITQKVQKNDSVSSIRIAAEIKKHLGNYKVDVTGATMDKSVEVYQLKKNGQSVWLWVDYIGKTPFIDDRKSGTWWLDSKGSITIRIQGNSGPSEEVYSSINGSFIESTRKKRILVKTEETF